MMGKEETLQYLREHGVDFEITEHKAVFNMGELDSVDLPYPDRDAKNLFVRDDKKRNYYLITVKGDRTVDLKRFRSENGLRSLSFASSDDLMTLLGLTPGSVTPLGLLNDSEFRVTLFLDRDLIGGIIGVHPNDNTATLWMKTDELIRLIEEHGNTVVTTSF